MPEASSDTVSGEEAFDLAPCGMAILGLDGRFLRVNRALCDLLGMRPDELLARTADDVVDRDGRPGPAVRAALLGGADRLTVERRMRTAAGEPLWVAVSTALARTPGGAPRAIVAQVTDVSERKRIEDDLRHAADHDVLTGLRNRRRFELDLAHQVERCRRYGESAAVVLLDLDDLKRVNDTGGHAAGDAVLVAAARILEARLRSSDLLARIGGDEFAAILPHVRPTAALGVAQTLVAALAREAPSACTGSAGVVVAGPDAPPAADVIAAADRAMYAAKRGGRSRAVLGALEP